MRLPKILVLIICYLAQVGLSESANRATCTVTAVKDIAFTVLMHLAGFYYISAADVEARVLPLLEVLVAETTFKTACLKKKTVEACCASCASAIAACVQAAKKDPLKKCLSKDLAPCTAGNSACYVKQDKTRARINSVDAFCENKFENKTGKSYKACKGMDNKASSRAEAATHNWKATLQRNYDMLAEIRNANKEGATGLDKLCPSQSSGGRRVLGSWVGVRRFPDS